MVKDNLKNKIKEQSAEISILTEENSSLKNKNKTLAKQLKELLEKNESLEHKLAVALQKLFGKSSEKSNELAQEEPEETCSLTDEEKKTIEEAEEEITVSSYTRKKGRKPLPKELPREDIIYDLPKEQKICACGHNMHEMGREISEQLEYIPAVIKVLRHIRLKYACRHCESCIKTADLPKQPIPKSIATAGLLAHTLYYKFDKHIPLYRQERIWQEIGIDIIRSTLANWVIKCAALLQPIYNLIKEKVIEAGYVQADETTLQVLHEKDKAAKTKSYIWEYCALPSNTNNTPCVIFEYQPTRGGYHAGDFLEEFSGFLQTDGFPGYNKTKARDNIIPLSCWAHARRGFMDIVKTSKTTGKAHVAVSYIRKLYAIEKNIKNLSFDEIAKIRQEQEEPILAEFKIWLDGSNGNAPPKGPLGKAITYVLDRWDELIIYINYGFLRIDTNNAENKIRPIAIGRKNFLFCNTPEGANAATLIYTLIANAKLYNLHVYNYLKYILTKMPNASSLELVEELLPWNLSIGQINSF